MNKKQRSSKTNDFAREMTELERQLTMLEFQFNDTGKPKLLDTTGHGFYQDGDSTDQDLQATGFNDKPKATTKSTKAVTDVIVELPVLDIDRHSQITTQNYNSFRNVNKAREPVQTISETQVRAEKVVEIYSLLITWKGLSKTQQP